MYRNLETGKYKLTNAERDFAVAPLLVGGALIIVGLICWFILYTRDGNYVWFMVGAFFLYFSITPIKAGIAFLELVKDE